MESHSSTLEVIQFEIFEYVFAIKDSQVTKNDREKWNYPTAYKIGSMIIVIYKSLYTCLIDSIPPWLHVHCGL